MNDILVSGGQPTGELHIGNYLGAIRHWINLQEKYPCYFFIADYHAMTVEYDPKKRADEIFSMMVDFLALGLNPKKATLFLQSDVPEVAELAWFFSTVTPVSFLERMIEYKEKVSAGKNANVGLFTYPVLMAADILMYGGTKIPVGTDQRQHVELARDIARFFNNRFGETFAEPTAIFTETPKIMSLVEPTKKMSKSAGADHYLALADSPEILRAKIKKAVTDTGPKKSDAEKEMSAGAANLFLLLKHFGAPAALARFEKSYQDGSIRYSELKDAVADAVADYFADYRARRAKLLKTPAKVRAIFTAGAKHARAEARKTMKLVRKKIGLTL